MNGDQEGADVLGDNGGMVITTETSRRRDGGLRSLAVGGMGEHVELAWALVEAGLEIDRLQRRLSDALFTVRVMDERGALLSARVRKWRDGFFAKWKARRQRRTWIAEAQKQRWHDMKARLAVITARAVQAEFVARAALSNPDAAAFGQGYDAGWRVGAQLAGERHACQAQSDADTIHALRAQVLDGAAMAVRSVDAVRAAAAMAERERCLRIVREAPLAPDTKVGARQLDQKRRIAEAIERGDG